MLNGLQDMRGPVRSRWDKLGAIDWPIARALALRQDRRLPLAAANAVTRLGDGPIYLLIIVAVILFHPHEAAMIIVCAGASILLLHSIYPMMKRATARPRPRDVEADFPDSIPTLDKYSFPSGHVMTLTAALTPIVHTRSGRLGRDGVVAIGGRPSLRLRCRGRNDHGRGRFRAFHLLDRVVGAARGWGRVSRPRTSPLARAAGRGRN